MASKRERDKSKRRRADSRKMMKTQEGGFAPTCVKLPDGLEFCKIQKGDTPEGTYKADVMPYKCTENNLAVQAGNADAGSDLPLFFYKCHRIKTPDSEFGNPYACRRAMFGKKCAVCDWLKQNSKSIDEDLAKELRAKDRMIALFNMTPGKTPPKLEVFDTNSHGAQGSGFFDQLQTLIESDESYADYWIPEDGLTLKMTTKKQKGFNWHPVNRIDLVPRKVQYDADIADEMPNPEEFLIDPGYDEVMKLLEEGGESEDDEDDEDEGKSSESKSGGKKSKTGSQTPRATDDEDDDDSDSSDDDDDDNDAPVSEKSKKMPNVKKLGIKKGDIVMHDDVECEVIHISGDGTSLKLKDEDGEILKGVGPDEVELVKGPNEDEDADEESDDDDTDDIEEEEEDEEEEAPKKKGAKNVRKSKAKVDEDEDDEEESDDDDEEESDDEDEDDSSDDDEDDSSDEDDEDDEDEDDDSSDDEDEDDAPPAKKGKKSAPKKTVKKPAPKKGKK